MQREKLNYITQGGVTEDADAIIISDKKQRKAGNSLNSRPPVV